MGSGRVDLPGGCDWLENVFGLGIHSAEGSFPGWQHRRVGELVHADSKGRGGWYVMEVRPGDALVMKIGDVRLGRPVERHEGIGWEFLWTLAVREGGGGSTGSSCEQVGCGTRRAQLLMAPVGFVSFVMTRKMLLGVRPRAESAVGAGLRSSGPG